MKPIDLSVKHLINIGVFTAIYFVIMFMGGMLGIAGPQFIIIGGFIAGFINAMVMMVYLVRTPTIGALTITGLLSSALMVLTGHSVISLLLGTGLGFLGDLVAASGNFANRWKNIIGYAVFSVWTIAPVLPIFFNSEAYFADVAQQMNSPEYAQQMQALFSPTTVIIISLVSVLIAIGAAFFGTKTLDKHFVKAGVV